MRSMFPVLALALLLTASCTGAPAPDGGDIGGLRVGAIQEFLGLTQ